MHRVRPHVAERTLTARLGWFLGVLWLAGGLVGHAQNPGASNQRAPAPTGLIAGVVVIADSGLPLDGVTVTLSGGEIRGSQRVVTDDDGRFVFAPLQAGRYIVSASKTGYVSVRYGQRDPGTGSQGTPIQLLQGQSIKDLRLPMPRGGVITGRVFDEKSRPSVATPVRVSQWVMTTGVRSLRSASNASTDDRGVYRVFGLAPGSYIVHAVPRNPVSSTGSANEALIVSLRSDAGLAGATTVQTSDGRSFITYGDVADLSAQGPGAGRVGYAPVYYPGSLDLAGAQTLELGVAEERSGVDLYLQRVPLTSISGQLLVPSGINMANLRVRLINTGVSVPGVGTPNTRAAGDGTFQFSAVAPGQYRAFAVATARNVPASAIGAALGGEPLPEGRNSIQFWAAVDVQVFGEQVSGVTLVMQPGMIVSGQVLFDGFSQQRPTDLRRVRVTLTPDATARESGVSSVSTNLDETGRFQFVGVVPGSYSIRASGGASGWWPKSALVGGRDALDFDLEVPERESVSNVLFTLSDRSAELSGTLEDTFSRPLTGFTVILFPTDPRYWRPLSRRIAAAPVATDGRFVFAGLPAGDYRLAAVMTAEPGQWFDPEFLRLLLGGSVAVSLGEGEQRVQNLRAQR